MENKSMARDASTENQEPATVRRKRRQNDDVGKPRFFLPKAGSSLKVPELGQELVGEGDALVRSFQSNQHFYVLTAWRAVAEQNGGNPVIKKEAVVEQRTE